MQSNGVIFRNKQAAQAQCNNSGHYFAADIAAYFAAAGPVAAVAKVDWFRAAAGTGFAD